MESDRTEVESSSSLTTVVDRNIEKLALVVCWVVGIIVEVAGCWPALLLRDLFPDQPEKEEVTLFQPQLKTFTYAISDGVDVARFYSGHVYLAAYILLPYPLLMRKCKSVSRILTEADGSTNRWCHEQGRPLYCSVMWNFTGISWFIWTSIHNYYHYLDSKKSSLEFEMVIKTIHKAGMRKIKSDSIGSADSCSLLALEGLDEDDLPGTEATLVERAAMAWIAREILEDDGEYVTDSQYSHYLALKATMELQQIIKELTEKRRDRRRPSMKERIKDSLEFCKKTSEHYDCTSETWQPRLEAFDESAKLSRRDPLRKIPPLVVGGKPFVDDDESVAGEHIEPSRDNSDLSTSTVSQNSVEVQTDPLSPQMILLFDLLHQKHAKLKSTFYNTRYDPDDNIVD